MKIILSGGGTGGHIYPAVAIADAFKKKYPDAEILFIGALGRMEMQKIPELGYSIEGLPIVGIQRSLSLQNVFVPFKLLKSLWKAYQIIKKNRPDVVIGTGGYASAPTLKMAQWLKVPYVVQEQNSLAGITNRWVGKGATRIFTAYNGMEKYFPKEKIQLTGNPIRANLIAEKCNKEAAFSYFSFNENKPVLLVLGGSLGAKSINQLIEKHLPLFEKLGVQVLWQCGKLYYEAYSKYESESVRIRAFINEMHWAYALADIIVSRAGASSVSELCVVGKTTIFIPSPNVAEDHQTKNAEAIAQQQAGILIKETELETFPEIFTNLIQSPQTRSEFSEKILKLAKPNATADIVSEIEKIIQK